MDQAHLPATETLDLGDGVKMEFVLIRPGTFVMGSETHEPDEAPARHVTLTQPYYLGKYEVTQAQWTRVTGENPSRFKDPNRPVDNVSWDECQRFVKALAARTRRYLALPTEAQWEYACRAGTTTEYSFGDDPADLSDYAWYCTNSGLTTHVVGQKKPNPWGLYDMHGNVYEWCADWYSEGPYVDETVDPKGAATGGRRVLRGGGWIFVPDNLRSSDRAFSPPDYKSGEYGLRCVLLPEAGADLVTEKPLQGPEKIRSGLTEETAPSTGLPERLVVDLGKGATMELILIHPTTTSDASRSAVAQPYYLGKYEVTQSQWDALMEKNWSAFPSGADEQNRGRYPVENVSWALCQTFIAKLNARAPGHHFRLPTEAEWEYACRAGDSDNALFAGASLAQRAWYGENAGGQTHPVGEKQPNAWGLYDMCGNVWEWCQDRYTESPAPLGVAAAATLSDGGVAERVLRGGAWNNTADHVTPWYRHADTPSTLLRYYGFRCAADAPSSATKP